MSSKCNSNGHHRIYIVDDHSSIQKAIHNAVEETIDMDICGCTQFAHVAFQEIKDTKPDVVIVDVSLKGGYGLDLLHMIRNERPNAEVVVNSMYDKEIYLQQALRTGASGYLVKTEPVDRVVQAIRHVVAGKFYLSRRMYSLVLGGIVARGATDLTLPIDLLSEREKQVFQLLGEGLEVREIEKHLGIHRKTIERHRRRAKEKLGFYSVDELTQYARQSSTDKLNR